ncbi:hypothetical protein [Brachyspira innocens]|uniref:hypothetical protein n=1 Tax=Brachyspira innocens TaxID=13264 RepID=UPI0026EDBBA1|nr:hypothetical protein [Brachyspira innocens]
MKKVSILLISVLFALAVSCSNPTTNPDNTNTEDGTQNGIALSERAGTYSGTMNGMQLVIVLNDQAQVTSITINNGDNSITEPITIKEGPTHTGTTIAPFAASVTMNNNSSPAVVKIDFTSATDASKGATAKVQVGANDPSQFNENSAITVELTYTK